MAIPLLQVNQLQVDFVSETGTTAAVKNISFEVHQGEIVAIVGESGSGKSVTALSVLQLLPASTARTKGAILFSDKEGPAIDLLQQSTQQLRRIRGNEIAMIFQEPMTSLNPVFTCGNQVMEALQQHQQLSKEAAKAKTIALFEKVQLPNPLQLFRRYPHQLSGGQKQRVMIAMAMSCQPRLLICDEPTTALDVTVQKTILQQIRALQQHEQMGVIFITHDLGVVAEVADRAIVMLKGEIVEQGTVTELFKNPQHPYTRGLLACRPVLHPKGMKLPVVSDFLSGGRFSESTTLPLLHQLPPKGIPANQPATTPLVQVEGLKVWFPATKTFFGKTREFTKAVDDVSFEVFRGETLGIVGESGSGKSTIGRALLRLIEPTAGRILYDGIDLTARKRDQLTALRKDIQIVFQDPYSSLNPRLTIGAAIAEPLQVHRILTSARQRKDKVVELLEKVNLKAEHFHRYPHEFSGGQRQRIVIARALALRPSFLVCDESVSALDVSVQAQVLNLLTDLKQEFGFTIVFISHDLAVIRYLSDRILVLNKGRIEEIGEATQVYDHPQQAYTQRLIASIPKGLP